LQTDLILGLDTPRGEDPCQQYRKLVQEYLDEVSSIWEDVQHGLIYGSRDFVTDIRSRFFSNGKNPELPQYNQIAKAVSPQEMIKRAVTSLDYDLEKAAARKRISAGEKDKRDLLVYLLWESGGLTNQEIGSYFGLTYSSVSRRVAKTGDRFKQEKEFCALFESLKSQIKV
jgi:putative transposase